MICTLCSNVHHEYMCFWMYTVSYVEREEMHVLSSVFKPGYCWFRIAGNVPHHTYSLGISAQAEVVLGQASMFSLLGLFTANKILCALCTMKKCSLWPTRTPWLCLGTIWLVYQEDAKLLYNLYTNETAKELCDHHGHFVQVYLIFFMPCFLGLS